VRGVPVLALVAMIAAQALVTMAAYSMSVAAPAVAADLGIDGSMIGLYTSIVYGFGMASALFAPGFIRRYGAIRTSQASLAFAAGGLLLASSGSTIALAAASGIVIGLGYGAPAPASSHLLVSRTPPKMVNLVFSIRQTGVPLGGVMAGLAVPPLLLLFDWRTALRLELVPVLLALLLLQLMRRDYDSDRDPSRRIMRGGLFQPLRLLKELPELRRLSVAAFFYSGAQLCFGAFMVVYMHTRVGLEVVAAGQVLAVFQITGVLSRPVWGWLADNVVAARTQLAIMGLVMAGAAVLVGRFDGDWPMPLVLLVCGVAGATASGFTGICFAEFARIGGAGRTAEATGLGNFMMFFGVMVMPVVFSALVAVTGGYAVSYHAVAAVTALSGLLLFAPSARRRDGAA